jgi:Secretion system C-terminal sorting domain
MGTGGTLTGDATPGTRATVQKRVVVQTDRDWRYTSVVLQVEFVQFTGIRLDNTILLNWGVITPAEIDHFEIEQSLDNNIYSFRGAVTDAVKINEQQSFNFTDDVKDINTDVIYYRLKVVGKSGAIKYSNIVVIRTGPVKTPVTVMPNPVKDYVTMQFFVEKDTKVTVRLVSETGKTVLVQNYSAVKGNNTIMIKNLTSFGTGLYTLQLLINNEVIVRKLVIAK